MGCSASHEASGAGLGGGDDDDYSYAPARPRRVRAPTTPLPPRVGGARRVAPAAPPAPAPAAPAPAPELTPEEREAFVAYLASMSSAAAATTATQAATYSGGGGGGGGGSGVTRAELARHSSRASAWVAIRGDVYDLTRFAARHPGGASIIFASAGQDATSTFNGSHAPYLIPRERLGDLFVGRLID